MAKHHPKDSLRRVCQTDRESCSNKPSVSPHRITKGYGRSTMCQEYITKYCFIKYKTDGHSEIKEKHLSVSTWQQHLIKSLHDYYKGQLRNQHRSHLLDTDFSLRHTKMIKIQKPDTVFPHET